MRKIYDEKKTGIAQAKFETHKMLELVEQGVYKQAREPHDRPKVSFAPSGLGYGSGTCPRMWWYNFKGGVLRDDAADAVGILTMANGTATHETIQKAFADSGILIDEEIEVKNEYPPIRGFIDLMVNWQGEETLGEIKTTSQESFISKKAKSKPAGYHLLQLLIYMKVMDKNKGFLLYSNNNSGELFIIPVYWTDENRALVDNAFEWMKQVYDNATSEEGKLPERPFRSMRSKACKSCAFLKHCWKDDDGEVELPVLEVPA